MVEDLLKSDGFLAIGLLKEGWETSYDSKNCPVHETVCLGSVVSEEQLDDGRFFLLTQGVSRAKLIGEEESDLPYRVAKLELLEDVYASEPVIDRSLRQQELVEGFRQLFPKIDIDASLVYALEADVPLGELCDVIAHALRLEPSVSQKVLAERDVDQRSDLLLDLLRQTNRSNKTDVPAGQKFPPSFSVN
jgi:Lon protease-like protein